MNIIYRLLQMVVFPANMFGCERVTPIKQTIMFYISLGSPWLIQLFTLRSRLGTTPCSWGQVGM